MITDAEIADLRALCLPPGYPHIGLDPDGLALTGANLIPVERRQRIAAAWNALPALLTIAEGREAIRRSLLAFGVATEARRAVDWTPGELAAYDAGARDGGIAALAGALAFLDGGTDDDAQAAAEAALR